ncbi:MAG: beta-ketoacyl-[acyl-carrier-protein] synthase family protein [Rhodoferax sp.]|uniref:beta-ketoacyl-[acyl-carrier-protein] synthase family protein n=1 Tax=Rhodoferax sp. TaxID=50421 RepID=UPI0014019ADA|nr:beta-ketoacyl-[acyl-carrier-protein] synthase family protein [Rhodoferax sp.]NDP40440.1 beta-ketoacyl-[acyl-carrier-protein] synthase family protein [Rhodoferax sp.]
MRRVAVTGIGVVSPLGHSPHEVFEAARAGRSGIHHLDIPDAHRMAAPLAATVQFDGADHFEPPQQRLLDRVSQFAVVAARRAFADAGCELTELERERTGVFLGTGMGGTLSMDDGYQTLYGQQSDRIKPMMILQGMHNAPAAWIAIEHKLRGPNLTYSTACSSSSVAIGEAWLRLASGVLDVAIAGGSEAPLSLGSLKAWEAMHTLASVDAADPATSCKPFSKNRSGMVLGEGAALVVLEPWDHALARGATIYGEIVGYGLTTDSGHIARPSVDGQAAAIRSALASAGLSLHAVDSINAHGTGTQANDSVESSAIKLVFGARADQIPISATKALHGHLLGAAGALEFVLSLLALRHNVALPTMHLQESDPQCDLDYVPNLARPGAAGKTMLSHSFAFGGTNAVLALRAVD